MTQSRIVMALLALSYVAATFLVYVTFRRSPDHSVTAVVQWTLLYAATVLYPVGWTMLHFRVLRRLGLADSRDLHQFAWSPVIVGATSLLLSMSLLWSALR